MSALNLIGFLVGCAIGAPIGLILVNRWFDRQDRRRWAARDAEFAKWRADHPESGSEPA